MTFWMNVLRKKRNTQMMNFLLLGHLSSKIGMKMIKMSKKKLSSGIKLLGLGHLIL